MLLILFLDVLQVCVMRISAFCFIFTSNKVEMENFTLYLEMKVSKFVLVLLDEQVPCSGVNLHEITVFCALSFMLFYKIPALLIMGFIFIASQN